MLKSNQNASLRFQLLFKCLKSARTVEHHYIIRTPKTLKIILMSIPATEKVYCPYPKCSVLMSRAEVLPYTNGVRIGIEQSMIKKCIQCRGIFCINCKVPWPNGLSCYEYKMRNPNPTVEDAKLKSLANTKSWRQCKKCSHMIELAEGCYHITCRCGYEFCYMCGAEWRNKKATCNCKIWDERNIVNNGRPERNVVNNGQRR
ncbi:RBR-type E3 ubiquitin transferase [Ranunculus cassubicifolius]